MRLNHEELMLIGGAGAFVLTLYWVRGRELREKYALGWLAAASMLLVCGAFPDIIKSFARACGLSYPAAALFIALVTIYIFSFTVSVSLSRYYKRGIRLTQELALLEQRVAQLERHATLGRVVALTTEDASTVAPATTMTKDVVRPGAAPDGRRRGADVQPKTRRA